MGHVLIYLKIMAKVLSEIIIFLIRVINIKFEFGNKILTKLLQADRSDPGNEDSKGNLNKRINLH